eukprot:CAMPEP_0185787784 /NCGR_PEP_ID=MMETSP1174-20130828/142795_1 /TAXON_ID=35687 /ORGANISM="Dictyocha speculum, Strain CCMP1381" /LENGTH=81 /DNA_ID=CAMNT_0028481129 /DNA_START=307 /DNA_END=549 /DNA_ORIENTATION=+
MTSVSNLDSSVHAIDMTVIRSSIPIYRNASLEKIGSNVEAQEKKKHPFAAEGSGEFGPANHQLAGASAPSAPTKKAFEVHW